MKNPIKGNRIVDRTFATRLLNFASNVTVFDACSEDERDSMISYAKKLLRYQIETVTDPSEKDYLNRVGVYSKYKANRIQTEDGFECIENDGEIIYSILKKIQKGDQILHIKFNSMERIKSTRLYFKHIENCKNYLENGIRN